MPITIARTLESSATDLAAVTIDAGNDDRLVVLVFAQVSATSAAAVLRALPFLSAKVITWESVDERQQWLAAHCTEVEVSNARVKVATLVSDQSSRRFLFDAPWCSGAFSAAHVVVRDFDTSTVLFGSLVQVGDASAKLELPASCGLMKVLVCGSAPPTTPLVDTSQPIPLSPSTAALGPKFYAAAFCGKDSAGPDVSALLRHLQGSSLGGKHHSPVRIFWPPELLVPLVLEENAGTAERDLLHRSLMLPHRRAFPDFVAADVASLQPAPWIFDVARVGQKWEGHLVCLPHTQVISKKLSIAGSTTSIVGGKYDYYHYQVDGFKDDGWGCAYRSMQTVLSWFQYQMYVRGNKPMPTINQIQQILAVVDPEKQSKPRFVGSSEWIGSFEVMLVLQHLVPDLECRIHRLEQGMELESSPQIHRMLQSHFARGGPPVMIGGSSYAHTILGIDVNIKTSEAQYLVLDPHYSATTTVMKTVIQKGWCGWKVAKDFFKPDSWYNLCIPCCYSATSV